MVKNSYILKVKFRDAYITVSGRNNFDASAKITQALIKENCNFSDCGGCGNDRVIIIESGYRH